MPKKNDSPGAQIAQDIIEKCQSKTVADMQSTLKEIFGPIFQAMLNGEIAG